MCGSRIGLESCHLLQDPNGLLPPAQLCRDHPKGAVGRERVRGRTEGVPEFFFGFGELSFSGKYKTQVHMGLRILRTLPSALRSNSTASEPLPSRPHKPP